MKALIIENNIIVNIAAVTESDILPGDWITVNDECNVMIGDMISQYDSNWNKVVLENPTLEIQKNQQYLSSTDWYDIRAINGGKPTPDGVTKKRNDAREKISNLRIKLKLDSQA